MINKLIYKELKLSVNPQVIIFLLLGPLMIMIPNYPRYVPFFYAVIPVVIFFTSGAINNDMIYTACLPVKRSDCVKARFLIIGLFELSEIVISIPFGIVGNLMIPGGNKAGINVTVAFYGLQLILFAAFNFVFLVWFYKKAEKSGWQFLCASLVYGIFYAVFELPVWMKTSFGAFITSMDAADQIRQLPILCAGIAIWFAVMYVSFRLCVKRFEKISL